MNVSNTPDDRYGLVTAAYNEATKIETTIQSVISQTVRPGRWIIVSDGSTDGTDDIVRCYADKCPFIELLRLEKTHGHSFESKVRALNAGFQALTRIPYDFVGNLDADVSILPLYFAELLKRCQLDTTLGVVGGSIYESDGKEYRPRALNSERYVAGAVQFFRAQCYASLGGFPLLKYGGEDWCVQVTARMKGWQVRSFPDLKVYHHRTTGSAVGVLRNGFRQGLMDQSLGSHPLFEAFRLCRRLRFETVSVFARLCGFAIGHVRREHKVVSDEFVRHLRQEELARLRRIALELRCTLSFRTATSKSSDESGESLTSDRG